MTNLLVLQNVARYRRSGVYTDVVITGFVYFGRNISTFRRIVLHLSSGRKSRTLRQSEISKMHSERSLSHDKFKIRPFNTVGSVEDVSNSSFHY